MKYLVLLLLIPVNSFADVYKCDQSGKLIFSDTPCSPNAEKVLLKKTNQSHGYIHDLYLNELGFEGNRNDMLTNINSVIQIVVSKGKDCKRELNEGKTTKSCFEYMNYVMEGGAYRKAYSHYRQLFNNKANQNLESTNSQANEINKNLELVAEYTSLLREHLNNN